MATRQIRPFSNGTQFMDWQAYNCCDCKKYDLIDVEAGISTCPIAEAIADHACGDDLSKEMATRMGYLNKDGKETRAFIWRCAEFDKGKPAPKEPPRPLPMDQQLRKSGAATLPGFEEV